MRKICAITGTRAEYGLLHLLLRKIKKDPELSLQLIVTGMHLSPEFGLTWKDIAQDGFKIDRKIEMLLSSDTPSGIIRSMGIAMIGFSEAYDSLKPDLVLILGDRFEIFAAAGAATVALIPLAHLHGGELTEGAFDEAMRHSITKMSHLHFTATDAYRRRVIQLGEDPDKVFNVGSLGVDNIQQLSLLTREEFETSINFKLNKKNLLITFHPVTLEQETSESHMRALLTSLDDLVDTNFIFTEPNADTGGRIIIELIDDFVSRHPENACSFKSLGQLRYLSAMQFVDALVGNSSSGLIEAPSFKIGTINIGDRQKGRIKADSVIDCSPNIPSIKNAIKKVCSDSFKESLRDLKNPYGEGGASEKVIEKLKTIDLSNILKKRFFDLSCLGP